MQLSSPPSSFFLALYLCAAFFIRFFMLLFPPSLLLCALRASWCVGRRRRRPERPPGKKGGELSSSSSSSSSPFPAICSRAEEEERRRRGNWEEIPRPSSFPLLLLIPPSVHRPSVRPSVSPVWPKPPFPPEPHTSLLSPLFPFPFLLSCAALNDLGKGGGLKFTSEHRSTTVQSKDLVGNARAEKTFAGEISIILFGEFRSLPLRWQHYERKIAGSHFPFLLARLQITRSRVRWKEAPFSPTLSSSSSFFFVSTRVVNGSISCEVCE